LGINILGIARTGLLFAGSTRIFAATCFSKFAVADFHNLFDFIIYHLFYLIAKIYSSETPKKKFGTNIVL